MLERALASGQTSHSYLFTGPEGVGKTTMALAFAQALLCPRRAPGTTEPCGVCVACRKVVSGNHPDLLVIEPLKEGSKEKFWITIEQLREAERLVTLAPYEGERRVVIIPRMRRIQEKTVNTLLKTLEEPPPSVTLILIATEPSEVLPTILSRCQLVSFPPIAPEAIAQALRARWSASEADAARLAGLACGSLGWAVRAHQNSEAAKEREEALKQIASLASRPVDERMRMAAALGPDNASARRTLDLWTIWWRDVTLAASGAHRLLTSGEIRATAERIGPAIGPERARAFMATLLEATQTLDVNANPRLLLENLALDVPAAN
jgi:DNA polymerase-3 subunit delta'